MASALAPFHCLLVLVITLLVPAIAQVYNNISVGSALFAIDDNSTWTSPSGDFAFGFRRLEQDQFLLAIWFAKIPDETIVWSANRDYPAERESKVELTTAGQLVLKAPRWMGVVEAPKTIDVYTKNPYGAYYTSPDVSELILDKSGYLQVKNSQGSISNLSTPVKRIDSYYRATLDFDGIFRLYAYPKNFTGNQSWSAIWHTYGKPECQCPPGFSLLDVNNEYSGCKQNDVSYISECNEMGSVISEDQFEFLAMESADWPLADYELLQPTTEYECKNSCLRDCYCAVAIFQDPKYNNGTGRCWKKKLPLSNGRFNSSAIDRKALFKKLKANSSSLNPTHPNPGQGKQNQAILILAILLGKIPNFYRTLHTKDLDMNLRLFTYKDLEEATSGFKEELGRGSFGIVYKGVLVSSYTKYVAVKKLDKMVREGEREFKTEVTVIGQTHHKNLVRLLGYCDEGDVWMLRWRGAAILTEWAYECYSRGKVERLVENDEEALSDMEWVKKLVMVAIWCVQDVPLLRPSMREVTHMLEGILEISAPPSPFLYSSTSEAGKSFMGFSTNSSVQPLRGSSTGPALSVLSNGHLAPKFEFPEYLQNAGPNTQGYQEKKIVM
uniref:non-specific serine/threonine protein kinase n=1 Tax=Fagus sylvatica TaxID=28930 RepID=A0A2N9F677_FAGSY